MFNSPLDRKAAAAKAMRRQKDAYEKAQRTAQLYANVYAKAQRDARHAARHAAHREAQHIKQAICASEQSDLLEKLQRALDEGKMLRREAVDAAVAAADQKRALDQANQLKRAAIDEVALLRATINDLMCGTVDADAEVDADAAPSLAVMLDQLYAEEQRAHELGVSKVESKYDEAPMDEVPYAEAPMDESKYAEAPMDEVPDAEAPMDEVPDAEAPTFVQCVDPFALCWSGKAPGAE
jgi:hypothetical protein